MGERLVGEVVKGDEGLGNENGARDDVVEEEEVEEEEEEEDEVEVGVGFGGSGVEETANGGGDTP